MRRLREHIDGLRIYKAESAVNENADVPRKGSWVAGNIHQPLCAACKQSVQHGAFTALARRIDQDGIWMVSFAHKPWKDILGISTMEHNIFDAVLLCIENRICDRFGHGFNSIYLRGMVCKQK